jgi:hypothetical protein
MMARLWLFGPAEPEPERRGSGPSEDVEPVGEPTHKKYQLDENGKPTAHVNCYCNAKNDHPH